MAECAEALRLESRTGYVHAMREMIHYAVKAFARVGHKWAVAIAFRPGINPELDVWLVQLRQGSGVPAGTAKTTK